MSGYPPAGPGGFGQPGFNPGPPPQQYSIGAVTRTSGAAITSLIFGLVGFCVPAIGGLIAIITGLIGIKSTGNPAVKGRAMAIIGLLLGLLSFVGYGALGVFFATIIHRSGSTHDFAQQYITELANGDEQAVANDTAEGAVTPAALSIAQTAPFGKMTSNMFYTVDFKEAHIATGAVTFSTGKAHQFKMQLKAEPNGQYKVESFIWQN